MSTRTMSDFDELPALVRPKSASLVTGLCTKTLARLFDEGRVSGLVLHRQRRYARESLRALVEGRGKPGNNGKHGTYEKRS